MPALVVPSYLVAFGYVFADTHDKYRRASQVEGNTKVVEATVDTLLWQTLASVMIPGLTINRVVYDCLCS